MDWDRQDVYPFRTKGHQDEKDLPDSDLLERILDGGIVLESSLRCSDAGVDVTGEEGHFTMTMPVVLVVEDNPECSQVVTLLLGLEGIKVITADNGSKGLEKCKQHHPDLIITDIRMPYLDGIEMIRILRADSQCREVPIIVFTVYSEMAGAAIQAGANGVLSKTDNYELLLKMVKGFLHPPEKEH